MILGFEVSHLRLPARDLVWTGPYLRSWPWAERSWGQLAMLPTHCMVLVCSTTERTDSKASRKSSHNLVSDFRKS